ncbi:MAG: site-2 protease family protein [Deltaproteobacteria bacterium]|nr:site-2 protease family protein [Deltaproteobacteria bacterium]
MASLFWFIVLIGILIFAHEGGHFLFAKLFRVKVLTFSLGFGTPVSLGRRFRLSWKRGETEYRIAWFPIGGFVRMLGDDPTEPIAEADQPRAFLTQPPWKRLLIIFGGPLFSVMLAVPIYFTYNLLQSTARAPVIGRVIPGSPAAEAGLLPGDEIVRLGTSRIESWEELDEALQAAGGGEVELAVRRDGQGEKRFRIKPYAEVDETGLELLGERYELGLRHQLQGNILGVVAGSPAARAGIRCWDKVLAADGKPVEGWAELQRALAAKGESEVGLQLVRAAEVQIGAITIRAPSMVEARVRPVPASSAPAWTIAHGESYTGLEPVDLYVMDLLDGYPAQKAGVQPGDKIVGMFGKPIYTWEEFSRHIILHKREGPIPVTVRKPHEVVELELTPAEIAETNDFKQTTRKPGMGVTYQPNLLSGEMIPRPNRLAYALKSSVTDTWRAISMNVLGFVRIFQGKVKATEAIGGPIMIFTVAGKSAERGWRTFLTMMAFLSVLLGLLNLLPIPILDGGHIAFIAVEVMIRKPVPLQARIVASYVGLVLLIGLMAFAIFNDIHRYWPEISSVFG